MSGELDLSKLLKTLKADVDDGVYVFCTLPDNIITSDLAPLMIFKEHEGTTIIIKQEEAEGHNIPHEFPCRMITLNVHSSLEAVGFIARIATLLAQHGMGVNPVAGFYHDHLFIPIDRVDDALALLNDLRDQST